MRKAVWILLFLALCSFAVYGQTEKESDIFVKTVSIIKILVHELGYVIKYNKVDRSLGEFYIPFTWFNKSGGKAEIRTGNDSSYPFFSIYWVDGQFSHIKLYLQESMSHPSWGQLTMPGSEIREKFDVVPENFKIDF